MTLPSGDVLLLERRFTWLTGIAMRLRRIASSDIVPGALVDGPALMVADMAYQIDNMEGLSAHTGPDGGTILTMISDMNKFFPPAAHHPAAVQTHRRRAAWNQGYSKR